MPVIKVMQVINVEVST